MGTHRSRQDIARRDASNEESIFSGRRAWPQALALLVAMAAAVTVALYQFVPPAVVPSDAPATEFSAERAMEDVRVIAKELHPMGSPEHEEEADYIVGRLEELGLSPQTRLGLALSSQNLLLPR